MFNPFQLFDVPVQFEQDEKALKARYLALQKQLHPDNFAHKSEQEQRLAMQRATQINDAWETLCDPVMRAQAIINLHLPNAQKETAQDFDFLMQQMTWRERLETIEATEDFDDLEQLQGEVEQAQRTLYSELNAKLIAEDWAAAQTGCDRLRFMQKLQQELERVEMALDDF